MKPRIDSPTLKIDADTRIEFTYMEKTLFGLSGDLVATALFANGVRVFSRSLKYHRPRGLYSLEPVCTNTMMNVDKEPNINAETVFLKKNMAIEPQNVVGNPEFDFMGFMDKIDRAMPAGFYYRMFHKPATIWPLAAKFIRRAAGLGVLKPEYEMTGVFDEIYPSADVCVIGGGPAGMKAAISAAEAGLDTVLFEQRPWLGGFYDYRTAATKDGEALYNRGKKLAEKVHSLSNIRVFTNCSLVGAYNGNILTAVQNGSPKDYFDQRYIEIQPESVVVATGCIERPLLFENNERPGIMQIECAHRLARHFGILPGNRAVFSVGHDLGLEAAVDLFDMGVNVTCIADLRTGGADKKLVSAARMRGIPYMTGWTALDTEIDHNKMLKKVVLGTLNGVHHREYECDLLAASAGLTPRYAPMALTGTKPVYDEQTGFFLPEEMPENMHAAGRVLGLEHPDSIEISGELAGWSAAQDCGIDVSDKIREGLKLLATLPGVANGCKWVMSAVEGRKTFICFDEDVTVKNVNQTIDRGFDVPELVKRYSAAGTGPGQSGISGHNLPLFIRQRFPEQDARPTTERCPLVPVRMAAYAGAGSDMCKRTPVHEHQKKEGGVMQRMGVWKRARYFSKDRTAAEEIENVRQNVGMIDVSTLGKFRLYGPDSLKALQRIYVGNMSKVRNDRIKYSAMVNEDGCLVDDGVVVKTGENDYYFTTSTARAGMTVEWLRYHTRYENWKFSVVNLTDAMGAINLAGPRSGKVLEKLVSTDISNETFPYAGYREMALADKIPARIMRLGFVGELSFEIHVPSSWMPAAWNLLKEAGEEFSIRNFGLEAQNVLRLEKGHVIIGSESEQRTTLHDLKMGFLWYRNKPEAKTVGEFALRETENQQGRLKLVGMETEDPERVVKDGSPIVENDILGYVCTSRYSKTLKKTIGMALVNSRLDKIGTTLNIYEDDCRGETVPAKVTAMPFYDPEGHRLKM